MIIPQLPELLKGFCRSQVFLSQLRTTSTTDKNLMGLNLQGFEHLSITFSLNILNGYQQMDRVNFQLITKGCSS